MRIPKYGCVTTITSTTTTTLSISTLSNSSKSTTETGSPSSQQGVAIGPLGTSGGLSGTTILGIVLGTIVFLFIVALGLAFWRRRRSSSAVARQDALMTSEWMDRWEDSVRMQRSSNAHSTRSMKASVPGVDFTQVSRLPNPPSPSRKPQRPQKRAKKPYESNMKTDTNALTVQIPMTPSTSGPPTSSTSTSTNRGLNKSSTSPKTLTYSPDSDLRSPSIKVTVMYSFVPHLRDELPVKIGDQLRVIQEFDDGWALCVNAHGKQGMVPVECLAVTGALDRIGEEIEPDLDDARLRNRGSSLEPLARAER